MKNIIIGFMTCLSLFIIIGATETPRIIDTPPEELIRQLVGIDKSSIGKYQGFTDSNNSPNKGIYMINTENAHVYKLNFEEKKWQKFTSDKAWIKD
ncbi:MAG: hypothetical protein CMG00_03545 [Candidatus Marinimicrobia bacterium]|nr:hypothetical protein [Candidatus Neomarinimicrobiota bacterium]